MATEKLDGGNRSFEFDFSENANWVEGHNHWRNYAKETLKDDQGQTVRVREVYTNHQGKTLLTKITADNTTWWEYREYGEDSEKGSYGQVTLHANPSALASCSVGTNAITPTYNSGGLVRLYEYHDDTTATSSQVGSAKGLTKFDKLRCGGPGGAVSTLREYAYVGNASIPTVFKVASVKEYLAPDDKIETQYAYEWHSGDNSKVLQQTTTLPVVPESQNGPGGTTGATRIERYDEEGRVVWLCDERDRVTYNEYDNDRDALVKTIQDVNSSGLPTGVTLPTNWPDNTDALNLETDYTVDDRGRVTEVLGPPHKVDEGGTEKNVRTAAWTVYDDDGHRVISSRGFKEVSSGQITVVNPVSITESNDYGQVTDEKQAVRSASLENTLVAVTETFDDQTDWCRWTHHEIDDQGRVTATRVYHDIPSSGNGQEGADNNYNESNMAYDWAGRQYKTTSPGGTITWTTYDGLSRETGVYIGDDDTGGTASDPTNGDANHMRLVTSYEYDGGGAGDGNQTKITQHVDGNSSNDRVTTFTFDWRNRREKETSPADDADRVTYVKSTYDNLDRAIKVEQYQVASPSDVLLARRETDYDDRGRTWRTKTFPVTAGSAGSNYLAGYTWYDDAGNIIKAASLRLERIRQVGLRRRGPADQELRRLRHGRSDCHNRHSRGSRRRER